MAVAAVAIGSSAAGSYIAGSAVLGLTGFTAFVAAGAISFAISYAANEILGLTPSQPDFADEASGILQNLASPTAAIPIVYGFRRVGAIRVFAESNGDDNEYLHLVMVASEGEILSIENIYLNDVLITDEKFDGYVDYYSKTGADDQPAIIELVNRVDGWTTDHRLRGTAYSYIRLKYDQEVFASGLPQITFDVKGVKVHDPRDSITKWSDNPALCIRDYLTNTRYGRGIPESVIDDASFIAAANYCDENVTKGGASATRYTCNGVVDTNKTSLEIIRELLTSCRGFLVFSGGKYRLVLDKPETGSFTFNEDNIVGQWQINLGSKQTSYNRIRAEFFNPERSWQGDIAVVDSEVLRAQDNNLMLEREITLPYTTDAATATQIATMALNQSRQQITCSFNATITGLRAEIGDVVYVTHSTPAWTNKAFRIMAMTITSTDEVSVALLEYDDQVYDFGTIEEVDATPNTNLPSMFTVVAPSTPTVTEEIYVTRNSAGVKARAIVSWSPSADVFVKQYELQYKTEADANYRSVGLTSETRFDINDISPNRYYFRVKAINTAGYASEWRTTPVTEIFGLLGKPAALTNVQLNSISSLALLSWDQSADLDVRLGGRIEVRHSTATSGASWGTSVSLGTALAGTATVAVLPLLSGTYLVRAVDSSGVKSDVSAIVTTAGTALTYGSVGTANEHTTFTGSKTNVEVDGIVLQLTDTDSEGTYYFANEIDAGSVKRQKLTRVVQSTVLLPTDLIDSRTELIDSWDDFDGTDSSAGDCKLYVRHTDDDPSGSPSWSDWELLTVNEYNHRAFQFKAVLSVDDPAYNIRISTLSAASEEIV
jgi:predicted phage tail protein